MAKEILIYGTISTWSAQAFIQALTDAGEDDIVVRINSDGGDPEAGWGMISKFAEYKGKKSVKVDGKAHSSAMFFCLFADDVEALNVSEFVAHRAAYPSWIESNPEYFTDLYKAMLANTNKYLRKAFEDGVDVEAFTKLKKVTVDELFSMDSRIDVLLDSKEAEKIGLVNKVTKLTISKKAEIEKYKMAAQYVEPVAAIEEPVIKIEDNKKIMKTLAELIAAYPEMAAQLVAQGVSQERDRVGSLLPYLDADQEAVVGMIKSDATMSATVREELNVKMFAKAQLGVIAGKTIPAIATVELPVGSANTEEFAAQQAAADLLSFRNEARGQIAGVPLIPVAKV